jgi:hypothetical protein
MSLRSAVLVYFYFSFSFYVSSEVDGIRQSSRTTYYLMGNRLDWEGRCWCWHWESERSLAIPPFGS